MLLTSAQAAEILKCSQNTVAYLVKAGRLTDQGITEHGKIKHLFKFKQSEVVELAKTYKHRSQPQSHETTKLDIIEQRLLRLAAHLMRVEDKIDTLVVALTLKP